VEEKCHFNDAGNHHDKVVRRNVWVGVGVGDRGGKNISPIRSDTAARISALGEDGTGFI
jgi:hypothetical protein